MTRLFRIVGAPSAAWLLIASLASASESPPVTADLLAPLTSAYMRAVKPGEEAELHRELFEAVLGRVQRNYARDVDAPALIAVALKTIEPLAPHSGEPAEVFNKSINAALASLDPYSRYLDPRAQSVQRSAITGAYGGIGLQVDMAEGLVRVVAPMPGTPAARAGLKSGDLIVSFDSEPVQGMALAEAVSRMRGEPGTSNCAHASGAPSTSRECKVGRGGCGYISSSDPCGIGGIEQPRDAVARATRAAIRCARMAHRSV